MIISLTFAVNLKTAGQAAFEGRVFDNGNTYLIVNNRKDQRTDHVYLCEGDLREHTILINPSTGSWDTKENWQSEGYDEKDGLIEVIWSDDQNGWISNW